MKLKQLSEDSGSSGPPLKCQRAGDQTGRVPLRQPDRREKEGSDRKRKREKKEEAVDRWERSMGTKSNSNMIETRCVGPDSAAREEREREAEERSGSVRI